MPKSSQTNPISKSTIQSPSKERKNRKPSLSRLKNQKIKRLLKRKTAVKLLPRTRNAPMIKVKIISLKRKRLNLK